tara:strand:- start:3560 stop:3916 length:357 start_codon:yes stop_codon:yes gene_type:complete
MNFYFAEELEAVTDGYDLKVLAPEIRNSKITHLVSGSEVESIVESLLMEAQAGQVVEATNLETDWKLTICPNKLGISWGVMREADFAIYQEILDRVTNDQTRVLQQPNNKRFSIIVEF